MSKGQAPVTSRKLIEVALPLEAINRESAKEKSVRHGHPSTLHLWWARRPAAAARAFLFAQLVDDPSSDPSLNEDQQRSERERLHRLMERLAVWDNTKDESLIAQARAEILRSTGGQLPEILDPFAGGGTIPLEAQRLGLEAHASDLNPVAVLINKALIQLPSSFYHKPPVHPGQRERLSYRNAEGIAEDVGHYGQWMLETADRTLSTHYPLAVLPDGTQAPVVAWIWARTLRCPNPACKRETPMVRSWQVGRKSGNEHYVLATASTQAQAARDSQMQYEVISGIAPEGLPGIVRNGTTCVRCNSPISAKKIREISQAQGLGEDLIAIVADGGRRRVYLSPTDAQIDHARIEAPCDVPDQTVPTPNHDVDRLPMYGMPSWSDSFTNRQLNTISTLCRLIPEVRAKVLDDALAHLGDDARVDNGRADACAEYADCIATYLAFAVSKATARNNTLCTWETGMDRLRGSFQRQAIAMTWDFAEANPLTASGGGLIATIRSEVEVLSALHAGPRGLVEHKDALTVDFAGAAINTDPPYYDNISYADISDFFYVWLRMSLRSIYPDLFATLTTPKHEELVASAPRRGGKDLAKLHFEEGFKRVFHNALVTSPNRYPMVVYYAFKQSDSGPTGDASTGWETLLHGMISSGWEITSTWPVRSELPSRMIASGTNALASSIVLSLRPRQCDAESIDRRTFVRLLRGELPAALRRLQEGSIAPVDLPQAAIGPGMSVYSRYVRVSNADGTAMGVREALALINEVLDEVLSEQEGDFDATSRFALAWYRQHGYEPGSFGDADNLARARNTSVATMDRDEILVSRAGKVQLVGPAALKPGYDVAADDHTSNWEALHYTLRALETDGIAPAGRFLAEAVARPDEAVDADRVKELAHLLFRIADDNKWAKDALAFNALVTSWPDILAASREVEVDTSDQGSFGFDEEED